MENTLKIKVLKIFSYFHIYAPEKSSEMINNKMILKFFETKNKLPMLGIEKQGIFPVSRVWLLITTFK